MARDFISTDAPQGGVQRLIARFSGHAYDPHRHETYAIGMTMAGAQAFRYRGHERVSHVGESMVLHPDELHDGHSDMPDGFLYRMVYVEPWLIRDAAGGATALPFVPDVVARDQALAAVLEAAFDGFPEPLDPLARDALVAALADILLRRGDAPVFMAPQAEPVARMARLRALLDAEYERAIASSDLEGIAELDRFEIARHFRRALGTSPHRYLIGRRLAAARLHIIAGEPLSAIAARVGFADQSHMTRHFKARFGMTPGRFAALVAARAA
ncbi:AraC family transcriptional regulator [Kaistia dalseonensis]|uniref:AraC-like DNA-binding protein n=1 Tax=Kaistia dalseonensis TaxID=410840 RepID=A0ABU0H9N0_9HYPH|nr:AraC family transcriptional regulator [Kaistia dalseonensis]MCX5496407.1 AraC family transcriptional regulator [Kaistia dalseonensis]MDQ0439028.1 AraC-like DNA-binding protein [Kaistia dalseonensis]